jgi:hypothetical protein
MKNCQICHGIGFYPRCIMCGQQGAKPRKSKISIIKDAAARDRLKLNVQAYKTFRKTQSSGSGCESFDSEIKDTCGDWKE